jgi:hypothetical protein
MVRRMLSTEAPGPGRAFLERAVGGATQVLLHEFDALSGHWAELRERIAVAREARGIGELVRLQVDLLPETRARLALDQRERRALLRGWLTDLRGMRAAA